MPINLLSNWLLLVVMIDAETIVKPDISFDSCYSCRSWHWHAGKVSRPSESF